MQGKREELPKRVAIRQVQVAPLASVKKLTAKKAAGTDNVVALNPIKISGKGNGNGEHRYAGFEKF